MFYEGDQAKLVVLSHSLVKPTLVFIEIILLKY